MKKKLLLIVIICLSLVLILNLTEKIRTINSAEAIGYNLKYFADLDQSIPIKTAIVLLPGIHNRATDFFSYLYEKFEPIGYDCYPLNLPKRDCFLNNGNPPDLSNITMESDAAYVIDFINEKQLRLKYTKLVLIGHSRGGLLAQMIAAQVQCDLLVLLNPALPKGINALTIDTFMAFKGVLAKYGDPRGNSISRDFETFYEYALDRRIPEKNAKKCLAKQVYESGNVIWELGLKKPAVNESEIRCPILIIGGSYDRLIPPSKLLKLRKKYSGAHLAILPYSHYPFVGKNKEFVLSYIHGWCSEKINQTIIRPLAQSARGFYFFQSTIVILLPLLTISTFWSSCHLSSLTNSLGRLT